MIDSREFQPDWASPPGDTIADVLQERSVSVTEFAHRMEMTLTDVSNLLEGRTIITRAIARQLTKVLGGSVEFWISRDYQYRQDMDRLHGPDKKGLAEIP